MVGVESLFNQVTPHSSRISKHPWVSISETELQPVKQGVRSSRMQHLPDRLRGNWWLGRTFGHGLKLTWLPESSASVASSLSSEGSLRFGRARRSSGARGCGAALFSLVSNTSFSTLGDGRSLLGSGSSIGLHFKDNKGYKWTRHLSYYGSLDVKWPITINSFSLSSRGTCFQGNTASIWHQSRKNSASGSRRLWTGLPVQMGRRSSKIATRKGAQDAKKAKLYGKMGKQIISAVKTGGSPNPTANSALAVVLQLAKDFDVPKDIVERNIKKASEKGQQDFVEITYEVYGFGGVGLVVEVLTDNVNRAAATVRDAVKKCGGKMADPGSVLFNFRRSGVVNVRADKVDGDTLLVAAMDAGAEDVLEPTSYEDEDEDDQDISERFYKVVTAVDQYAAVTKNLQKVGIPIEAESSGLELIPTSRLEPDDEAVDLNKVLMEKLLELDDVDAVFSNQA